MKRVFTIITAVLISAVSLAQTDAFKAWLKNGKGELAKQKFANKKLDKKEAEECLQHFLAGLPGVQQKIIQMKMNGCTFEEIEKATGLQQTNIRVIISRVRKRFREFYDNI